MALSYSKVTWDMFLVSKETDPLWLPLLRLPPFVEETNYFFCFSSAYLAPPLFCQFLLFLEETTDLKGHH